MVISKRRHIGRSADKQDKYNAPPSQIYNIEALMSNLAFDRMLDSQVSEISDDENVFRL
jgi:hypothetical protein